MVCNRIILSGLQVQLKSLVLVMLMYEYNMQSRFGRRSQRRRTILLKLVRPCFSEAPVSKDPNAHDEIREKHSLGKPSTVLAESPPLVQMPLANEELDTVVHARVESLSGAVRSFR